MNQLNHLKLILKGGWREEALIIWTDPSVGIIGSRNGNAIGVESQGLMVSWDVHAWGRSLSRRQHKELLLYVRGIGHILRFWR